MKKLIAVISLTGISLVVLAGIGTYIGWLPRPADMTTPPPTLDRAAFARLLTEIKASRSSALVVTHRGQIVYEWYADGASRQIEAMSVTKSVVSMAIGRLVTMGKLQSLDEPLHSFFPEWATGARSAITIRQLLNHTSGIQANPTTEEVYDAKDAVSLALSSPLTTLPGTAFQYNNKAVNALAAVVKKLSGERMDVFIQQELFVPLGISDARWTLDPAGNPYVFAGLQIHPRDLAKLGMLMAQEGRWNDAQILSGEWVRESTREGSRLSTTYGLLWWLIPYQERYRVPSDLSNRLIALGGDAELVAQVARLSGEYDSADAFIAARKATVSDVPAMRAKLKRIGVDSIATPEFGRMVGYRAEGYLGQYLVVLPRKELVAVRMIEGSMWYNEDRDRLWNFVPLVGALASE